MSVECKLEHDDVELKSTHKRTKLNESQWGSCHYGDTSAVKPISSNLIFHKYSSELKLKSLRCETRSRLYGIFRKLVGHRNWNDASGVLGSLLKGTGNDQSPQNIRLKFWATLEILQQIESENIYTNKTRNIYDAWMKKTISRKKFPIQIRSAVQLDFVLFSLSGGNIEDAHQVLLSLTREIKLESDALSNMVMGLAFYELWYSSIPKEFQLGDCEEYRSEPCVHLCSERSDACNEMISSKGSINVDKYIELETPLRSYNLLFDLLLSGNEWDSYLLPLQLPQSKESLEQFNFLVDELFDYRHKNALIHLRNALYSTPPAWSALLPLIQLLLLAGRVEEALHEIEALSKSSNMVLLFRIKAGILEAVDGRNLSKLSACNEEILHRDPTCGYALSRLVTMHENGDYSTNSLMEMIALHLDAVFANVSIWRQLALCFLKMSTCDDGLSYRTSKTGRTATTALVFEGSRETTWPIRRRWWLTRHFSKSTVESEIRSGESELLVYKAACASHIYGASTMYVNQVEAYLKRNSDREQFDELLSFLAQHTASHSSRNLMFD